MVEFLFLFLFLYVSARLKISCGGNTELHDGRKILEHAVGLNTFEYSQFYVRSYKTYRSHR